MFRTRWALAALLACLVACLLAGCSDDDPRPSIGADPTPSSTSPSASVSTSPTVSPTSSFSPSDTVSKWIDAQNVALRTGDTSALRALAATDCEGCSDYPDGIEEIYDAGGHFEGGEWKLIRAEVDDPTARPIRVNVGVRIAGGKTIAAAGDDPTTYGPKSRLMVFELEQDADGWLISLIGFLS